MREYKFCKRNFVSSVSLRSLCFSNVNLVHETRKFIIFHWVLKMYLQSGFCDVRPFVRELKVGILFLDSRASPPAVMGPPNIAALIYVHLKFVVLQPHLFCKTPRIVASTKRFCQIGFLQGPMKGKTLITKSRTIFKMLLKNI